MIVPHEILYKIENGSVSQLRVRIKRQPSSTPGKTYEIACTMRPGGEYSVRSTFGALLADRVRVISVGRQKIEDVTDADAVASGYDDRDSYLAAWRAQHKVKRANVSVWVVVFEVGAAPTRLLTPAARPAGTELGYTQNPALAMPDEPPVIDEFTLALQTIRKRDDARERQQARLDQINALLQEIRDDPEADRDAKRWVRKLEHESDVLAKRIAAAA